MRHYSLKLLCLALTFLLWVYPAAVSKAYTDVRDLEAFLDGVMAIHLEQSRTPGAVIAVVNEGGILLAKGYGYANLEEGKKVTTDTLFRVGSISKLFVWTAVMQLQQEGLLDLDRDINAYLDFEIPSTLWDGTFAEPITLRHLMSHTAGFEDQNIGVFVLTEEQLKPLSDYLAEALPARVFPPGQISSYSNYGSSLAAYIVQRIAGMPFADYVEKQIFAPLGITGSTFRQPVPDHLLPQLSAGYQPLDELYLLGDFELCQSYPAGSLSASAEDMATFMLAHLTEETYGLMHKQSFTHHPALPGMAHGFFEMDINGQRIITHGGDTILFHSGLYLLPEEQVGIFMSFNGAQASEVRSSVLQAFMDRYFPQDTKPLTPSGDLVQRAAQIRGSFHLSRSNFTDIEAILRLFSPIKISVDGDGYLVLQGAISSHRYIETDTGLFRSLDGQALLYPARDSTGQVTHFYTDFPAVLLRTPWYATA
ncbi:MAG TPA: beta-lactamase family protein, partial [Firmicutes bacterium]|nr:beta-lactamase family protein [Bacillota bacterium]